MASTFSPLLGIELMGLGDQNNTWGTTNNTNLGTLIEQAIAGSTTLDVTSGNITLTDYNGASDQSRNAVLRIVGTPGVTRNIIAPASSKAYIVANGSNASVVLKTSVSTGITITTGEVFFIYYDTTLADFKYVGKSASSTNVANTLVLRDGSGNFAAGTITAALVGATTGAHNGSVGATTPNTGAFTTLSSTGNTTLGDAAGDTLTVNATPTFNVAIPVTSGGTGVTTSTGTGSTVRNTSPTLVTPVLGTPTSGTLTNCTGLPLSTGIAGTLGVLNGGTGVTTSTGTGANVLSTSPTLVTPILGTPASGTLTNCTGLPVSTGVSGLAAGAATFLATPSSANLASLLTDETGTGSNVFATSPTLAGTPLAPTATAGTNTTQIATTAFVGTAVSTATATLGTMSTQNANSVAITGGSITGSYGLTAANATNAVNATNATNATLATDCTNAIGYNQTWQNMTASRTSGTTYTNSTGKPIQVFINFGTSGGGTATITVGGVSLAGTFVVANNTSVISSFIVPNATTYVVTVSAATIGKWTELR